MIKPINHYSVFADVFNNHYFYVYSIILDFEIVVNKISKFIENEVRGSDSKGVVLGLSGGIDSTVALYLATRGIDTKDILGLIMPDSTVTSQIDIDDAVYISKKLNINYILLDITDIKKAYNKILPENQLSNANLIARIRMNIIYYYANLNNLLVIGTSDKSELKIGYFTKYGDGSADILPLGDLYKSEVRELGKYLNIPISILYKKSSPSLLPDQTAEDEIGMEYIKIDNILRFLDENILLSKQLPDPIPKGFGFDKEDLRSVLHLISTSNHKRSMPKICSLTN
ncbi:MAG: NAD+ synthase [Nitrososphaeraceae archaeon]|nr:NAD+ synthase [Nitrososphaeraceae archaeon]